eukprot:Nitzschia sp. Nitz4//scaffold2_size372955//45976//48153//NITZ4_000366-RA/size372955-processed-gene-0.472-mRNA-1//-1//CDS//3329546605//9251//frame0
MRLPGKITAEFLSQVQSNTQKELDATVQSQKKQQEASESLDWSFGPREDAAAPKHVQLAKLCQTADSLALENAIVEWIGNAPVAESDDQDPSSLLLVQAEWCCSLAQVLLKHPSVLELGGTTFYEETYLPLYNYLLQSLTTTVKRELALNGCANIVRQCQASPSSCLFGLACHWVLQLQRLHQSVLETLEGHSPSTDPALTIVRILLQSFVHKVRFHFVDASPDRVTSTRNDRLPEWLLGYLKEHALESNPDETGTPYQLLRHGLSLVLAAQDLESMEVHFWNEVVGLVQWVLAEREFFHQQEIAGTNSNPLLLYNAMEQFLLFDRIIRESANVSSAVDEVYGLMDTIVMANKELRQWWIDRERETFFSTLFDNDMMADVPKPLASHVSPRAEVFCALIRSVQWKASTLSSPGFYLQHVAVPLCTQFLDAVQETATDLRNSMSRLYREQQIDESMVINMHEWIELINGTRFAADLLLRDGAWQDGMPSSSQSDHDLARFGRSLERLVDAMIDEYTASFVETIVMEKAKMASYLMLASHILSSSEWEGDDQDLSAELRDAQGVLHELQRVCTEISTIPFGVTDTDSIANHRLAQFAPRGIWTQVVDRVADKFMEIILDVQSTTPDIWPGGAEVFTRDVEVLIGEYTEVPLVARLLDVMKLSTMTYASLQGLREALGGLVGASVFLDMNDFSSDGTIYDEAELMLKAKGFQNLELADAISILNRRRD